MSPAAMPTDVVLRICVFLDLQDCIRLLSSCSQFTHLFSIKDFWLKALDRFQHVHMQPLPVFSATDLPSVPLHELRRLAIHAYQLRKNWSMERAKLVSMRKFSLEEDFPELCVLPGTNLLLTNSSVRLVCWDTLTGRRLGTLDHEDVDSGCSMMRSVPFQSGGKTLIGISYKTRLRLGLLVIKVDYQDFRAVTLSKFYLNEMSTSEYNPISIPSVAVNEEHVGMVFTSYTDQSSILLYSNLSQSGNDTAPRPIRLGQRLGSLPSCMLLDGHFYINGQDLIEPTVLLRVCVDTDCCCATRKWSVPLPASIPESDTHCISQAPAQMLAPAYGVLNVTRRTCETVPGYLPYPYGARRVRSVYFWPAIPTTERKRLPELGMLAFYDHPADIATHAVGAASGRCVAIIDVLPQRTGYMRSVSGLGIVRYHADSVSTAIPSINSTSFHRLDTGSLAINQYTAVLAVDDALGVVYITHVAEGVRAEIVALAYA